MSAAELKERLRADLKAAMRDRKSSEVAVLRTVIAAIDNAEAVPIEGMEERLRAREDVGEAARRELDAAALARILDNEMATRLAAAQDYQRHDRGDDADRLRVEAELIARYRA